MRKTPKALDNYAAFMCSFELSLRQAFREPEDF
jgi:hypothetical protein